jgi:hypothetical protein
VSGWNGKFRFFPSETRSQISQELLQFNKAEISGISLYVRLGVRDYVGLVSKSMEGDVKKLFGAKYRMTKVEIIYMAKNLSYAGFVVSNGEKMKIKWD